MIYLVSTAAKAIFFVLILLPPGAIEPVSRKIEVKSLEECFDSARKASEDFMALNDNSIFSAGCQVEFRINAREARG